MHENTVRQMAARRCYRVCKSRRALHSNNHGEYQLVNDQNTVVLGGNYDASLDEIADYLRTVPTFYQEHGR